MPSIKPAAPAPPPIPRVRRSFRRHRSGAWKVAYADFVTALMALFIVLWMMSASPKTRQAISGYFQDPKGYMRKLDSGQGSAAAEPPSAQRILKGLLEQVKEALEQMPDFAKVRDHIQLSVTPEGLRIDLLETEEGMFFVTGSPNPTPAGEHLLKVLAAELERIGNAVVIEGHTDARPFRNAAPSSGYSNWELSADRANSARRLLHSYGLQPGRVVEVRGFADRQLWRPGEPDDPRNRRISIVIKA